MKYLLFILLFYSSYGFSSAMHPCESDAIKNADKLIRFHFGEDERIEIDENVSILHPLKNPKNKKQSFDVLEVWGFINKGQYRMRFIYAQMDGCVLMGQEILEHASL